MLRDLFIAAEVIAVFMLLIPFMTTAIALLRTRLPLPPGDVPERDIAAVITAYNDAGTAVPLVHSLLSQRYARFHIYLVADGCAPESLPSIPGNVTMLVPEQKLNSKAGSISYAFSRFVREHDAVVVFDPDNIAHSDFLSTINRYLASGFNVVQGRRTAKNLDTLYARLDALGELYYNHITRFALFHAGSSAVIAGSGMAIETKLFRSILSSDVFREQGRVVAGEDKVFQVQIVGAGERIAFADTAIVFDEKVGTGKQIERQRTRWLNSYFENVSGAVALIGRGIRARDFNAFAFGLATSVPPLIVTLGMSAACVLIAAITSAPEVYAWPAAFALFAATVAYSLIHGGADARIWTSVWGIPVFLGRQIVSLLQMGKSKRDFMITEHRTDVRIVEHLVHKERP
jgi:cellulose synthase/poly-beta-1,6-N-acetylglucosamine synthase-like glycosyltransferase